MLERTQVLRTTAPPKFCFQPLPIAGTLEPGPPAGERAPLRAVEPGMHATHERGVTLIHSETKEAS